MLSHVVHNCISLLSKNYIPSEDAQLIFPNLLHFHCEQFFALRPEHKNVKHSQKYIKKFSAIIFI